MIIVTALKWVPPFAQGQVRDLRARWTLEETGLPYEIRLLDNEAQRSPAYRTQQPFGQVPVVELDGEPIFESGAALLAIAERAGKLLGHDAKSRRQVLCWLFSALNSVEPPLMNLAEVDFFLKDEDHKTQRRPTVLTSVEKRLGELEQAMGAREYFVEEFSIADLMMSTVMRIVGHTDILATYPRISAFKARCEARPAFARALEAQLADFAAHGPEDMKWPAS